MAPRERSERGFQLFFNPGPDLPNFPQFRQQELATRDQVLAAIQGTPGTQLACEHIAFAEGASATTGE
jgi:hypothetical protein